MGDFDSNYDNYSLFLNILKRIDNSSSFLYISKLLQVFELLTKRVFKYIFHGLNL